MASPTADLLESIVAAARRIVEVRSQREPAVELRRKAERRAVARERFRETLQTQERVNIIAECKRRSPSKGVLRSDYDPVSIARSYAGGGAAAISVLTEPTFFDGSLEHLAGVRAAVEIPLLRKDFIVTEYQLLEARAAGADAVLLIVAALGQSELASLLEGAQRMGLDALVEVHTEEELTRAIGTGARIIGVNNRNLRTLEVDVRASENLIKRIPVGTVKVSESGLRDAAELMRLKDLGYDAFLIGERFMTTSDPGAALAGLLRDCVAAQHVQNSGVQA